MTGPAVDLYGAAFIARHGRDPHAHRAPLIEPGVRGLTAAYGEREICLLVIDDRAYGRLAADVATARQGVVSVFETAAHCDELMGSQRNWKADRPRQPPWSAAISTPYLPRGFPTALRFER